MSPALQQFCDFYRQLGSADLNNIDSVYSQDVVFEDPAHHMEGLDTLTHYFKNMMGNLKQCTFDIHKVVEDRDDAFVHWTMQFAHPSLSGGKTIEVPGVTHLRFGDKVFYHRDFMDMGNMLYEHIPVLGSAIRFLKKRMAP